MRPEELAFVCQEAARDVLDRHGRPLPPTVVLPASDATRVISVPELPDDDRGRLAALDALARAEMLPQARPAWGFVAEAELADGTDVALVAYGAHGLPPRVSAAPFLPDGGLDEFVADETLDDWALPFLSPLQRAAEGSAPPPGIPGFGG